jgi:triacylglycerol esterase/lipase EstA (alpha/beta hydrolase family)
MLARCLIALLALELGLYVLAGAWIASAFGASIALCLLLALLTALVLRMLQVSVTFALAHRFRAEMPAEAHLTRSGAIAVFFGEFLAFTALFTLLQPLARWFAPRSVLSAADAAPPVVLIPGIYCNAAVWWSIKRRLASCGMKNLVAVTLEPPLASIDVLAHQLGDEIERICEETKASQVVLVGHSMGGLIARAYLRAHGAARVARVITLGSPHHGSALARLAIGADGAQLRPGNPWLAALNAAEQAAPPLPMVSLFTWHDNFIAPQDSPILAHATNIPFVGVGHLTLLFSAAVAQRLYDEIRAGVTRLPSSTLSRPGGTKD